MVHRWHEWLHSEVCSIGILTGSIVAIASRAWAAQLIESGVVVSPSTHIIKFWAALSLPQDG